MLSRRVGASLVFFLLAGAPLLAQHPTKIEGLQLIPSRPGGQPLELDACSRHSVPADGGGFEEIQPCTERLLPAPAARLLWLEAEAMMSPGRKWLAAGDLAPSDLPMPMVSAGKVTWPAAARQASGFSGEALQLYLLHLDSHQKVNDDEIWEMARWASLAEAEAGVAMPAGRLIALIFDDTSGELLAMSRPQDVTARRTTELAVLRPDANLSQLFLELQRPNLVARKDYRKTEVFLDVGDGQQRAADALVLTQRQVLAIFYDMPAKRSQLTATAANGRLEGHPLRLTAGKVLYEQARLFALPSLRVTIDLPSSLRAAPLALEVLGENQEPLRRVELPATAREATIDLLPAQNAEVLLQASPYVFRESADLRRGDLQIHFAPQPLTVHGTVFRGEDATPASLVFTNLQDNATGFTVETDENGRYEATFWKSGLYQAAMHFRADLPPYTEDVEIPDRSDHLLDLHAPGLNLQVRVVDATSGEALTRSVIYLRHWAAEGQVEEQEFAAEGEVVDLPPFAAGNLEIAAAAEGYLRSAPIGLQVDATREPEPLEIALSPATAARRVWLRDERGRPVRGALVRAQFDLASGTPIWEGQSNQEGHLDVPQEVMGSYLLIRADNQAAAVQLLDKESLSQAEDPIVYVLMPGSPLQLRVVGLGHQGRAAALALWLDGRRVSEAALAFFCGDAASDENGLFSCNAPMPNTALQVLAWDAASKPADALHATTLPALRQGEIEVPLVE